MYYNYIILIDEIAVVPGRVPPQPPEELPVSSSDHCRQTHLQLSTSVPQNQDSAAPEQLLLVRACPLEEGSCIMYR